MSRTRRCCNVCGRVLVSDVKIHRNSKTCIYCLQNSPYDLKIDVGDFHAELHSDAIRHKDLCKLLSNVKKLAKQMKEVGHN